MREGLLDIFGALVGGLDDDRLDGIGIVKAWSPVPYFGDLENSSVATVGLNPSDKEFQDDRGQDLRDTERRFHTLGSLNHNSWSELDRQDLALLKESCDGYFSGNPYTQWFGKLNDVIRGLHVCFGSGACHLDLVPYATKQKWSSLGRHRNTLLEANRNTLLTLVGSSPLRILVLNGNGVIRGFKRVFDIRLEERRMRRWDLSQSKGKVVKGFSYRGMLDVLPAQARPDNQILVLGFNHNVQGSFGMPKEVVSSIGRWVAREGRAYLGDGCRRT